MADSNKPLVVGLAGFGTVGGGLARLLEENAGIIRQRTGRDIQVKKVLVRNAQKARTVPLPPGADLTTNPDELINDPEIDVLVELMGGIDAPRTIIDRALDAGKHIVTANKALLAEEGLALFQKAAGKGRILRYEASVAGAVPVVEALRTSLAGNRISSLMGILNGTSNYILSEMTSNGLDFDVALKQAQQLGYAEADPTLDIDGHDAAHKLTLLIRLAYGVNYPYTAMPVRGIRGKRIAMIVQQPMTAFDPLYSMGAQLLETLRATTSAFSEKESRGRIVEALEMMHIHNPLDVLKKYPYQLSGGMLQRCMIAVALLQRPDIIIADEPTTALDSMNQREVVAQFHWIRERFGSSLILVSHDLGVVRQLAQEVLVMKDGVVQQIATPQEVFNHPANIFVAGFIGVPQMNFFDAQLVRSGNGFTVKTEDMNVALAPETCAQLALNWDGGDVKEITAGVRPEQILLADKGEEGALQGTVEVTELMGSTEHVHVTAPDGQFVLIIPVVDLEAKGALKAGDPIWFKFEKNATHLFDKVSGKNLI